MKTTLLSLSFILFSTTFVFSQKGLPSFGKVDKADLEMTDCEFDKGAEAMVLIDYGYTYYGRGTVGYSTFKTVYERRTRIKILKESGIDEANIRIPYYNRHGEERILRLSANTYNLDANGKVQTTEVKKSSIYSKRIDNSRSVMIIAFPEVKVGSIIEYSYVLERETYYLKDWYFQHNIPVRYSEYLLKIPQFFRFSIQPNIVDPVEDKQDVTTEIISADEGAIEAKVLRSSYIMRNLVGIKDEPFMGSSKDYLQRIEFHLSQIDYGDRTKDISTKWSDVINTLNNDESFGKQLQDPVPGTSALIERAKQIAEPEARMRFLYNELRNSVTWNEDDGIYTDNGIAKTWETKTGNIADINLLLIRLLNDAGIKTAPILFSTRDNGLVVTKYPDDGQFNTVMAFVSNNSNYFILDATNKVINYKLVPEQVVNTNGFIMEGEGGKWKEILSGKNHFKVFTAVQGEIDGDGNMKGTCIVNCYDYARVRRGMELKKDQARFKENYFLTPYPTVKIQDLVINNTETDSLPLEQKIKFSCPLNSSGQYSYFSVNLFSGLDKNLFVAEKRMSDVDFGIHQDFTLFGNFTIPAGYVFDGLPENVSTSTSDRGIIFNRNVTAEGNLLNIRITVEYKRTFYPLNDYKDFRDFHKKIFEKLNEQIVIKKKSTP